ncbi:hypothetical protein BS47DRAFT_1402615 [Hydnum rufescens UP504]|uniref:Uncharacterized protein n=1 Tax=Hydnum rufescens UP504 TaxID=1448309 RepID=A0A9P6ACG5_9AGAM|nr:hypothetical protein BS47DRAFT_1402615 [Hydnum rufescens UP504]
MKKKRPGAKDPMRPPPNFGKWFITFKVPIAHQSPPPPDSNTMNEDREIARDEQDPTHMDEKQ